MDWREIRKTNFTEWVRFADFLQLRPQQITSLCCDNFPLNVPLRFAKKMEKGNLKDPLFLQVTPPLLEDRPSGEDRSDPVSDQSFHRSPKLLHKYAHRVLLLCTGNCAMHCCFCFRREYPYRHLPFQFNQDLEVIAQDPSIIEVILSGGDPLFLSDHRLRALIHSIAQIPHIKILRIHTRFPIGIPERITSSLLSTLKECRLQSFFVLHINHPRELDEEILSALKKIQALNIPLLTQTVLLRHVNDSLSTLKELFLKLVSEGLIPYYLHQLDRIRGSARFYVSQKRGKDLISALREQLPGYAVPTYVQEIPFRRSKTPIV